MDWISSAILSRKPRTNEAGEEKINCFKKCFLPSRLATLLWPGKSIKRHSCAKDSPNLGPYFVDALGNLYLINEQNDFEKYGADGELLSVQSYRNQGEITAIDAGNAFEIYAFIPSLQ